MSEYRPGDKVVLPPYGVGVVAGIAQRSVAGSDRSYYQVDFPGTRSKAYVPVESPQSTRLRRALSPEQVSEILTLLREGRLPLPRQWAARHRKTTEILAEGDPFRIATLAGQLRAWELEKGLPDLDRQALRRALHLLAEEISQVLEISLEEARRMFEEAAGESLN
ncbi:CarD family transcriptional regulator [Meiothermus sp. QL-1]|uniref:CarD family transcriptional regulator n=1 Tax=Meiothermus sp. QL-1 TaxID=2058095 RepID=UPI000E0CA42E|nr:CarD family transcriptional regulator [Meiothermus sp. QL-1]RDI96367.1 CarD family transcriptional regulator [Meiothermus sp. QL-1]